MTSKALILLLASVCAFAGEVRGVWVDRSRLASRELIRETFKTLADANFNAAFVNVWSRGYPLWPSKVFEAETGISIDPGFADRDVLREAIEEAAQHGIAVIPWVEYGFVAGWSGYHPGPNGRGPIFEAHPDWLAKDREGKVEFPSGAGGNYFWMIHTHPAAQEFLLKLMEEIATNYNVPAIQFDRARYPRLDCGYDDFTKELYAKEHDGAAPPDDPAEKEWVRWRAAKLNEFVAALNRRVKAVDWRMLVTNAPVPYSYSYVNFAQDYTAWVREGSLDFVSPQLYRSDDAAYGRELDLQLKHLGSGSRLVPGINAPADPEDTVRMVARTREKGLQGVVIWYYGSLVTTKAFERLRETVYSEKAALPWR